ncbi:uncharacterized protein LOC116449259 isoform X1 [Corvus moneduloides]|uniref:uncharacterized protein LOC116449259 isoform X1 n=1 Tax=Corvus moneduloides TaxID=1196302 RepID=UPI001362D96D|nr:uncharacterized protein LOC116449259 isoform X1 [Corvus moneduloides]XP_031976483.1 uncharacterized protein LOC116449259 isoform X1 [Corvus moneduloides]
MAARPEVASASTQDGGEGRKLRHRHTKDGDLVRCFLTFSIWRHGRPPPPQAASIWLPERNADASPALARSFLRRFPLCGHRLWGQRRLGQAGAFRQSNRRSGVLPAAILRRSNSHIGAVPATSALPRRERQWRGARGAALPGRGHRGGCSGLGAKNIQNCHLTLTDSRNVFHSSCFGMGMAVGSSGRTSTQTQQRESWRSWKTLSLRWWNSWEMESSRSSKNRVGSRLQPGSPVTRAIQVHPPQRGEREHVRPWRISGRAREKKEGSSFTDLCHNPSCRPLLFDPGAFVLLDST